MSYLKCKCEAWQATHKEPQTILFNVRAKYVYKFCPYCGGKLTQEIIPNPFKNTVWKGEDEK